MEAVIRERHPADITLVRGDKGIFDVRVDGQLVFSKHQTGRFPEPDEVLAAIAARPRKGAG